MPRLSPFLVLALLTAALLGPGCGDNTPAMTNQNAPSPVPIDVPFDGIVTVNGAVTHPFDVQRPGQVIVRFAALEPDASVVLGLSLGTWNGVVCDIKLAADKATQGTTITGTASTAGSFCARVYDVGSLTGPVSYQIVVTHY